MEPRATRVWLPILIIALALFARLWHLWAVCQGPFSPAEFLPIDARLYHQWAIEWLAGTWPTEAPFERPPLYVFFVGSVYAVTGANPIAVLVAQCVLGAALCALVYDIAQLLFDDIRVALLSAAIVAFSGTLIYFDAQLLSGSLDAFFHVTALWLLLRAGRNVGPGLWVAAGAIIGLSALHRGIALLWLPCVLAWIWLPPRWRDQRRSGLLHSLALVTPVLAMLAPLSWHNAQYDEPSVPITSSSDVVARLVSGRFVPIATNSGINFYLGNHAVLRDLNRIDHPEHMQTYDQIRMDPAERGITSYSGVNANLMSSTFAHIADWPGPWLRLMALKTLELFNGTEIPRNTSLYADRSESPVLWLLLWRAGLSFPTGLLLPFGLVGLYLARRSWREQLPAMTGLAVHGAFIVAFFVTARYRLPMLPVLGVYAAYGAVTLVDRIRGGMPASALRLGVAASALAVIANLPLIPVSPDHSYVDHFDLAMLRMSQNRLDDALAHLDRAAELEPAASNVALARCRLTLQTRSNQAGLDTCQRAAVLDPFSAIAQHQLGTALEQLHRNAEALAHFKRAAELEPSHGEYRRAAERARRAAARNPRTD